MGLHAMDEVKLRGQHPREEVPSGGHITEMRGNLGKRYPSLASWEAERKREGIEELQAKAKD